MLQMIYLRPLGFWIALVAILLNSAVSVAQPALRSEEGCVFRHKKPPASGLTLTHLIVQPNQALCKSAGHAANLSVRNAVIPNYADHILREETRLLLAEAGVNGIGAIRTVLWFRHKFADFKPTVADQRLGDSLCIRWTAG